jgi:hypothetical protein
MIVFVFTDPNLKPKNHDPDVFGHHTLIEGVDEGAQLSVYY